MKRQNHIRLGLAMLTAVLAVVACLFAMQEAAPVEADAITNYYVRTVADGNTGYINVLADVPYGRAVGVPINAADYGSISWQVSLDITGTNAYTSVTVGVFPFYSNEIPGSCANVTEWFTGTEYFIPSTIATGTLLYNGRLSYYDVITQAKMLTPYVDNQVFGFQMNNLGRCVRLQILAIDEVQGPMLFTPTVYALLRDRYK